MNKLICTLACFATITSSVMGISASFELSECGVKGVDDCQFIGFDFKETGKIAQTLDKKGYKTVQSFKGEGAIGLVFSGSAPASDSEASTNDTEASTNETEETDSDECCDNPVSVTMVVKTKLNGEKRVVAYRELGITRLSFFGKNWEKVEDVIEGVGKSGKYYDVESDLGWVSGNFDGVEAVSPISSEDSDVETVFIYSGFGKAKIGLSKITKKGGNCGTKDGGCDPDLKLKSYKGWFAGFTTNDGDIGVFDYTCETRCDVSVFGGTWTAKFNKKYKSEKNMLAKYGVSISE